MCSKAYLLLLAIALLSLQVEAGRRRDNNKQIPKWKKQACEFPSSQNEYSHYICDETGDVKCLPGWQGDLCDVPICRKGCDPMTGYCQRPGECRCKLGFYGEKCDKCIPLPGCQHGYCNVSFECICNKGWDGLFCTEPICRKDCHGTRGYCELPGECRCRLGWSGPTCHDCQVLPGCQHGTCTKPLECKCLPGYTGILCQTPICASNCHRQRGYCRRPGECRCKVGWTGEDCSKCHPYPGCVNGDCNRPWECNCKPGWGGILCDEELNFCENNPNICKNGARCVSREKADGLFRCICPNGYRGRHCEVPPFVMSTSTTIPPTTVDPSLAVEQNETVVNSNATLPVDEVSEEVEENVDDSNEKEDTDINTDQNEVLSVNSTTTNEIDLPNVATNSSSTVAMNQNLTIPEQDDTDNET